MGASDVRGVHIRDVGSVHWADYHVIVTKSTLRRLAPPARDGHLDRETELPLPGRPIVLAIVNSGSWAARHSLQTKDGLQACS